MGRVPYREAWDLQRALAAGADDYLLLLEHPHVYTLGAHADRTHVLVDPSAVGADLVEVDRGGDVTYHGPGQLVGYPIMTVPPGPHQGPAHVHRVEQLVIDALVAVGIDAGTVGRLDGYPGVWIGVDGDRPRKIAAVGVRTARGRTTHGFACNVDVDLSMFGHIVPCGISDMPVTSLRAEGLDVTMDELVDAVVAASGVLGAGAPAFDVQRVVGVGGGVGGGRPVPLSPSAVPPNAVPPDAVPPSAVPPSAVPVALGRRMARAGIDPGAGLPISQRKPPWLRVPARTTGSFLPLRRDLQQRSLVTVCEEAGCPNIFECWAEGTATFMINGDRCTRSCAFCQVDTGRPQPLDPGEPDRVADAVAAMGIAHAVVTCVARDDLADGGAGGFAETIAAIRRKAPGVTVEVLVSDMRGDPDALARVLDAGPDILNHNIETVARLQRAVRPSAGYARSLTVLARAARTGVVTKSGIIVGMGEGEDEVLATMADLRAVGVSLLTVGQYLRPGPANLPVARWWHPDELAALARAGREMGFAHVQATPLTRSSHHAAEAAAAAGLAPGALAGRPTVGSPG